MIAQICSMLLRISESIDDVHRNNCILHRLVNFCLQIAGVEYIVLKNSYGTDEVLIHNCKRVSAQESMQQTLCAPRINS